MRIGRWDVQKPTDLIDLSHPLLSSPDCMYVYHQLDIARLIPHLTSAHRLAMKFLFVIQCPLIQQKKLARVACLIALIPPVPII